MGGARALRAPEPEVPGGRRRARGSSRTRTPASLGSVESQSCSWGGECPLRLWESLRSGQAPLRDGQGPRLGTLLDPPRPHPRTLEMAQLSSSTGGPSRKGPLHVVSPEGKRPRKGQDVGTKGSGEGSGNGVGKAGPGYRPDYHTLWDIRPPPWGGSGHPGRVGPPSSRRTGGGDRSGEGRQESEGSTGSSRYGGVSLLDRSREILSSSSDVWSFNWRRRFPGTEE